jgi:predicted aminopeptidase
MDSSSIVRATRAALAIAAMSVLTSGCYLLQAAGGQMGVMAKRQPITQVIANPLTASKVRTQLQTVEAIRDFASRDLLLPDNGSYRQYADIHRAYVVWNVVAAPEFSLSPRQWCFPIAGCVAYRGYFKEKRALRFAQTLRDHGLEVATGGVAAYSTLGHFDDPVLNTMLGWSDVQLASIVFHELTHQLLYVANDSAFNEALATTLEQEGVQRWLRSLGRERDLAAYLEQQDRYTQVVALLIEARTRLNRVYAQSLDREEMRRLKAQEFAALRARFEALKSHWKGHAPYEAWFAQELNNAHLASVATYYVCVPGFTRELHAVHGDLPRFYARARELGKLPFAERQRLLCGGG